MLDNQYFKKYVDEHPNGDLDKKINIDKLCTLDIDPIIFEDFANEHREQATVKWYHPRPFLNAESNNQAIQASTPTHNATKQTTRINTSKQKEAGRQASQQTKQQASKHASKQVSH